MPETSKSNGLGQGIQNIFGVMAWTEECLVLDQPHFRCLVNVYSLQVKFSDRRIEMWAKGKRESLKLEIEIKSIET